jgi:VanZ family protein
MKRFQGALAVCTLLIAYASLYPFWPLRPAGDDALAAFFLRPRHLIAFDVWVNILAYVPFGALACHRFRQAGRTHPIALALAAAAALSLAMEVSQLFIPTRVGTIYDVAANVAGAGIGVLAFLEPGYALVTRPLAEMRDRLFAAGIWGDAGLVLIVLWLLAQLNPALPFFGAGNIVEGMAERGDVALLMAVAVGMSLCGFALFVSALMRGVEGALRMTLVLLSIALWLKFAAGSLMLKPQISLEWVSAGRLAGLAGGLVGFIPMRRLGRLARIYLAIVLTLAGALFSKIFGAYSTVEELLRMFSWPHGQLAGFATLTRFLHELWPFAALVFLIGLFFHTRRLSTLLEGTQTVRSREFQ